MSRTTYDTAHVNCPEVGRDIPITTLEGYPVVCPECGEYVLATVLTGEDLQTRSGKAHDFSRGSMSEKQIGEIKTPIWT